jgi:hypothetical protein
MRKTRRKPKQKHCPFMDKTCLQAECGIYHTPFGRCALDLLSDNIYHQKEAMLELSEILETVIKSQGLEA